MYLFLLKVNKGWLFDLCFKSIFGMRGEKMINLAEKNLILPYLKLFTIQTLYFNLVKI